MTITTEPTTAANVPAWLNLDAIVSPEFRAEIASETKYFVSKILDLVDMAGRYQEVLLRYDEAIGDKGLYGPVDNFGVFIDQLVGMDEYVAFGWLVSELFTPDAASTPSEGALKAAADRFGVDLPPRRNADAYTSPEAQQ